MIFSIRNRARFGKHWIIAKKVTVTDRFTKSSLGPILLVFRAYNEYMRYGITHCTHYLRKIEPTASPPFFFLSVTFT